MKKQQRQEFPHNISRDQLSVAAIKGELAQMPDEADYEYKAFLEYCTLGPDASLADVGERVGMTQSGITRLRKRRHWLARIERWWMERSGTSIAEDTASAERQEALRRDEWRLHQDMLAAGREGLARWRASDNVPTLSEIAKFLELASRIGRLAVGLPLSYTEISGNPAAPIRIELEAALARAYGPAEVVDVEALGPERSVSNSTAHLPACSA